jgi:CheY-like chemotaxis protein
MASPGLSDHRLSEHAGAAILIVDDEEASRYVCRQMFRGTSYRIIEADGLEAAERARFERPALIILDLMMPGRTGFEVLDELKADPATREIPVVIHTSKKITAADSLRLSGRYLGVLPKSGKNRRDILEAIRRALGNRDLFADEPEFVNTRGRSGENQ